MASSDGEVEKNIHTTLIRSPILSNYIECCNTTFNVRLKLEEKKEKMSDLNDWPTPMTSHTMGVLGGKKPYLATSVRSLKAPYVDLPGEQYRHIAQTGIWETACTYSYRLYELLTDSLDGKIPDDIYNAIRSKPWIDNQEPNKDKLGVWKAKLHNSFTGHWNSPAFKQAISNRLEDCGLMDVSGYEIGPTSLLFPIMEAYFLYARNGLFMCRLHTITLEKCLNMGLLNHEVLLLDFVQFLRETCEYITLCRANTTTDKIKIEGEGCLVSAENYWLHSNHLESSVNIKSEFGNQHTQIRSKETWVIQTYMQLTMNRRNSNYDVRRVHVVAEIMKLFIQHILLRSALLNTLREQLTNACTTANSNDTTSTWNYTVPIQEEMDRLLNEIEWPSQCSESERSAWFDNCTSNVDLCRQIIARTIFSRISHPPGVHNIGGIIKIPANGFDCEENRHYLDFLWTSQRFTSYTLCGTKDDTILGILRSQIEKTIATTHNQNGKQSSLPSLQQRLKKEEAVLGSRLRQYKKAIQEKNRFVIKDKELNLRMKKEGQLLSGSRKLSACILNRQLESTAYQDDITFNCSMIVRTHVCEELLVTMEQRFFSDHMSQQQQQQQPNKRKSVVLECASDEEEESEGGSEDESDDDDDGDESSDYEDDEDYDPDGSNEPMIMKNGEREVDWDRLTDDEGSDDVSSEDSEVSDIIYSDEDCEDHIEAMRMKAARKAGDHCISRVVSTIATKSGRTSKQLLDLTGERKKYTKAVVLPPKKAKKHTNNITAATKQKRGGNLKQTSFDNMPNVEVIHETLNGDCPKYQKQPKATKQSTITFTQTFSSPSIQTFTSPTISTVATTTTTTTTQPPRGILKRKQNTPNHTFLDLTSSFLVSTSSSSSNKQKNEKFSNKRQKIENNNNNNNKTNITPAGGISKMANNASVVTMYC